MARTTRTGGVSLAKGPAGLIGIALLAYGVTGLLFGDHGFDADPMSGIVRGSTWLGLEGNGWTNLLFAAAGALLLFGAPLHWGAKTLALAVGLLLGAASVISLVDGDDVFGIFAANGLTKLVWGVGAAVLLVVALLPRVGRDRREQAGARDQRNATRFERDRGARRDPLSPLHDPRRASQRQAADSHTALGARGRPGHACVRRPACPARALPRGATRRPRA